MQQFQYKYGDKPLEGYTIQRAAGRGGFGEVYYALSDGGRQVALKVIQNYQQIELRGISQCMNLKNPHLVTIFDIKNNDKGIPFVIMEFVSGPSLRDLLEEAPSGLGEQKAAFFLREIAKGLSYLHECGIVHRDLKPGNIFYENGYVMIGDYGLSKAISAGINSGQTVTVGTVHYMAPEVGAGCYDRSIDIYALGVLLYEMLTGQVPFFGSSPGEILMKHMSAEPDLDQVPQPFARVIRKALAKDPADRYQNVQEMVEDIFGSEHVRNSVSQFSPESLSAIAGHVAQKARTESAGEPSPEQDEPSDAWGKFGRNMEQLGRQAGQIGDKMARQVAHTVTRKISPAVDRFRHPYAAAAGADPITRRQRRTLALITMAVVSLGIGMLAGQGNMDDLLGMGLISFLMIWGASTGILLVRWRLLANLESSFPRNFIAAALGIMLAGLFSLFMWYDAPHHVERLARGTFISLAVLALTNWWQVTSPTRRERVSLGSVVGLCALGFAATLIFHGYTILVIGVLAGTMMVVQIGSPFVPPALRREYLASAPAVSGRARGRSASRTKPVPPAPVPVGHGKGSSTRLKTEQLVPPYIRLLWLIGFIILLGTGLMLLIWGGIGRLHRDEFALAVSFGIGSLVFSVFFLVQSCRKTIIGWYRYVIKPLLLLVCLQTILTASVCLGCMGLRNEEILIALFFIIFPGILFLVVAAIPSRLVEGLTGRKTPVSPTIRATSMVSPYKRIWPC